MRCSLLLTTLCLTYCALANTDKPKEESIAVADKPDSPPQHQEHADIPVSGADKPDSPPQHQEHADIPSTEPVVDGKSAQPADAAVDSPSTADEDGWLIDDSKHPSSADPEVNTEADDDESDDEESSPDDGDDSTPVGEQTTDRPPDATRDRSEDEAVSDSNSDDGYINSGPGLGPLGDEPEPGKPPHETDTAAAQEDGDDSDNVPSPPDLYENAGLERGVIEGVSLYKEESNADTIRRYMRVKYKQGSKSPSYQLDIWIQSYVRARKAWSTYLQSRKFLKESSTLRVEKSVGENKEATDTGSTAGGDQPVADAEKDDEEPETAEDVANDNIGEDADEAVPEHAIEDAEEETSQRASEVEVIDDTDDEPDHGYYPTAPPPGQERVELTPEQIEAKELYDSAMKLLKSGTTSSSKRAYQLLVGATRLNHSNARELVAFSHLYGDYLPQNLSRSLEMFQQMTDEGSPRGQLGLGIMYAAGLHVNSSQAKALVYLTFAALGGDEMAQMILGYRFLSAIGVQASCETALIYYAKAAKTVADQVSISGGPAVQRVKLYDESGSSSSSVTNVLDDDIIQYYQYLADRGDTSAQIGLAQLYYRGDRGIAVDYDLAFQYYTMAASGGDSSADALLGKMYIEGVGTIEQNYELAHEYFLKAAEKGNPIGQWGMGMLYLKGNFVTKDLSKALKYFQKSADQNSYDGQLQLGLMYYEGEGVQQDYKAALKYLNLASQGGNVLALYNLGVMHASGWGVMRACHTAVELYKNVAERGPWAKLLMEAFDSYSRGYVDVAMLKYSVAAELGYEVAQSNAAYILDNGESDLYRDNEKYKRALLQWARAASQGSQVARLKLGDYHYYGMGTGVDFEQATQHYRVAGEQQNNAQAMYNLGYMHEAGLGLKQDLHLAKRFYDMAAESSKDAHIPVTLALARLNLFSNLDQYADMNYMWSLLDILHPQAYLGPSWDMYVITFLGGLFGFIVMLRTRVLRPA